ncbi:uncharacterized protein LOC116206075 isoform X2 [Punica granatum]|uniref:Uncharacterized protein LOC116206075 isoform X2 n=1 Tax=Punica granatum TaxID=22663 RepID=A0A6P8DRK3_PUNGR|nr:uncharacterized protein LOC116206075 isoform X2 [Punica granatum]XP_031394677.1 uncharacterized protein LOC116206075 isoform X2 [Punica granatum]XP_031394678.1 uncharacterized protein LOC116206075 isoform X2 [Punica granatum]XP_031394679.1 uncharacterized protein LOC116206075 isoform X2 [Punica granatum]XP_031394680.1 uncharacterized protein LOC116206075 isoform X2 [Punica granatum]
MICWEQIMERGDRRERSRRSSEAEFLLQWGNRKQLRRGRSRDPSTSEKFGGRIETRDDRFRFSSVGDGNSHLQPNDRVTWNSEVAALRSTLNETHKSSSSSPEEGRFDLARKGSIMGLVDNLKDNGREDRGSCLPRLFITLSSKEKEEDFLTMKGCKPPLRPRKRPRTIQRSLLLVTPGAWLADMSQDRYEVREKKSSKKRAKGLKAMTNVESASE